MRLMDANETYEVLTEYYHHRTDFQHQALADALGRVPMIEAEPVKRGWWVEEPGMFMCSVCYDAWSIDDEEMIKGFNYCPNCGAKIESEG